MKNRPLFVIVLLVAALSLPLLSHADAAPPAGIVIAGGIIILAVITGIIVLISYLFLRMIRKNKSGKDNEQKQI